MASTVLGTTLIIDNDKLEAFEAWRSTLTPLEQAKLKITPNGPVLNVLADVDHYAYIKTHFSKF